MRDAHIYGHPICEDRVEVPMLKVVPVGEGYPEIPPEMKGQDEVVVEWFGHSDQDETVGQLQFRFPLPWSPDKLQWMSHPERFRVAFLGAASRWPNRGQLETIVHDVAGGNARLPVIYVVSSHIGLNDGADGVIPAGYNLTVAPLITLTNDLITPRFFYNPRVIEEEQAKLKVPATC